jgi:Ca2+-binding RTX toxin-like protein
MERDACDRPIQSTNIHNSFGEIKMVYIPGDNGANNLSGTTGDDSIDGFLGNDYISAGGGNDLIYSGQYYPVAGFTDDDIIYGDTFAGEAGQDTVFAGYGNDTVYGDSNLGGGGKDTLYGELGDDTLYGNDGNDILDGGEGTDTLYGQEGNDNLAGGAGIDQLYGGNGNDFMNGSDFPYGDFADKLYGGVGDDTYQVDALDVIVENAAEGIDAVDAIGNYTLGANIENLTLSGSATTGTGNSLDNIIRGDSATNYFLYGGSGNDKVSGNDGNDNLDGGAGNDYLYGGYYGNDYLNGRLGADTMVGGRGNDKYVVDNVSDVVTENAAEGTDTVVSTIDYVLGANVENLTLTDAAVKGTGNALSNTVLGTAGSNVLSGQDGDDVINGRGGNDILVGGNGKDTLYGDLGADKFRFEFQSEGIDLIRDFNRSEGDKIEIIKSSFGATSLGQFSYNSTTGALSFDASPTDNVGPLQLATLTNKPAGFSVQSDIILS